MSILSLPLAIYEQIRAHGERTYPDECCGALLGRSTPEGWQVEAVVETGNSRTDSPHNRFRISPLDLVKVARRKLGYLAAAHDLRDLRAPPGNRLEALKVDRQGQHSIRINDQWRICFVWREGGAAHVEIVDYHG